MDIRTQQLDKEITETRRFMRQLPTLQEKMNAKRSLKKLERARDQAMLNYHEEKKKIKAPHRDGMANEIAAFANTAGGILVLGVEDKTRNVQGIERVRLDGLELWLTNLVTEKITPAPLIQTRLLEIPNRQGDLKAIVWVRILKSLFVHESPNGYFHRVGSSKRKMPPDLLARIFQQRSMARLIRFDEQRVPNATLAAIDPALKQRFMRSNDLPENR